MQKRLRASTGISDADTGALAIALPRCLIKQAGPALGVCAWRAGDCKTIIILGN